MMTLVISKGGTYKGGSYSTVAINSTGGVPVIIDGLELNGPGNLITVNSDASVTVINCTGSTDSPHYFLVGNRFKDITIEHNRLNGTAGIVTWCSNAKFQKIRYNYGFNITGATGPRTRNKTSFIQVDLFHSPNLEIAWNYVKNEKGKSAIEDSISLNRSGGVPGLSALIHDNFIDGAFMYPVGGGNYSGGGIMCYDPASAFNVTEGGYTKCYNNQVIAAEHYGIDCAGSHDIEIYNNRVVNDGTQTQNVEYGIRTFNWDNKTINSGNINVHDNFAMYLSNGKHKDYVLLTTTAQRNNVTGITTEDEERAMWAAKVLAAGIVIGPIPDSEPATDLISGLDWTNTSVNVRPVPLASENLGVPTAAGYCSNGDWIQYASLDFGAGLNQCSLSVAVTDKYAGQTLELHLDSLTGPLIGTLKPVSTGGWYNFVVQKCGITGATGVHDLYLVFKGTTGICNLKSFQFSAI